MNNDYQNNEPNQVNPQTSGQQPYPPHVQQGYPQASPPQGYVQPFYGTLPNAMPVPIPAPHTHVQLAPIVVPIAFVPYSTQNQPLFTFEDEE